MADVDKTKSGQKSNQSAPAPPAPAPREEVAKEKTPEKAKQPDADKRLIDPFWLRTVFPHPGEVFAYSSPSLTALSSDAVFGLDANSLLSPYEVSKQSVDEIDRIYRGLAQNNRIFVPEQAEREFARHRGSKVADIHGDVVTRISKFPSFDKLTCPMLDGVKEYDEMPAVIESMKEAAKKYKALLASLRQSLVEWTWGDRVSKLYREVFTKGRIVANDIPDADMLKRLAWRFTHQIPPGYKDQSKPDGGLGDLVIWFTLIKLANDMKKSVIFVCNEKKHDWVYRSHDEVLMPRIELGLEFFRETGQHFGFVSWPRFLELMGAKAQTVKEARAADVTAAEERIPFEPISKRLLSLLEEMASVCEEGPSDPGSGYVLFDDPLFSRLITAFTTAKAQYDELRPSAPLPYLNELERIVIEINDLNDALGYHQVRMKSSGTRESAALQEKCNEFLQCYELFCRATIPLL